MWNPWVDVFLVAVGGLFLIAYFIKWKYGHKFYTLRQQALSREEHQALCRLKGRSFFIEYNGPDGIKEIIKDILAVLLLYGAEIRKNEKSADWKLALSSTNGPRVEIVDLALYDHSGQKIIEIGSPCDGFRFMQIIVKAIVNYERETDLVAAEVGQKVVDILAGRRLK